MDAERAVTTSTKRQYVQFKIACNHILFSMAMWFLIGLIMCLPYCVVLEAFM